MSARKLKVVLTRRLPDTVETRLRELFDAELNPVSYTHLTLPTN